MNDSDKTLAIVAKVAGCELSRLQREQHLMADLGIDSPKSLQLMMDLEDELCIEISDDDASGIRTVGDVLDLVAAKG